MTHHNRIFTAAAVVTLALAIGATTAVYSLVYGVLLRPLPFVAPQQLVRLSEEHPGGNTLAGNRWLSHRTYHSCLTAVPSFPIAPSPHSEATVLTRAITYVATPGYAEAVGLRLRECRFLTVVGNVLKDGNDLAPEPEIYFVHGGPTRSLGTFFSFSLAIRTTGKPSALATNLRELSASIDPGAVVERAGDLADRVSSSMVQPRFATTVVAAFAGLGVTLAGVGLFAVLSYALSQRRRELGVRAALGASPWRLLRLVVAQGLAVTSLGAVVVLAGAAGLTRLLETLLFQVQPLDTLSFIGAPLVLLPLAILASLLPAMRAASVGPAGVLKGE